MTQRRLIEQEVIDPAHEDAAALLKAVPRRATRASAPGRLEAEWRDIEAMARAPRPLRAGTLVLAALGSAALGSVLTLALVKPLLVKPAPVLAQRPAPVAPLRLESGRLAGLPSEQPTHCVTPFGEAVWSNARFLLEVAGESMLLSVESGEVEWRDARGAQHIAAGQTLELPPAVLELPEVLRAPEPAAPAQRAALDGLDAENALFELALTERDRQPLKALEHLREYQRRFPRGLFIAEVEVSNIVALARLGRRAEAAAAVARFRAERAGDPLLPSVELISKQLEVHP
ncbi:MAG: hypothetical protein JNK82_12565 [Myxococcaceae bacterium]|nr:hypothetical protein [Myxococcaceae bacterium]